MQQIQHDGGGQGEAEECSVTPHRCPVLCMEMVYPNNPLHHTDNATITVVTLWLHGRWRCYLHKQTFPVFTAPHACILSPSQDHQVAGMLLSSRVQTWSHSQAEMSPEILSVLMWSPQAS